MSRLLSAGYSRLWKNKVFWLEMGGRAGIRRRVYAQRVPTGRSQRRHRLFSGPVLFSFCGFRGPVRRDIHQPVYRHGIQRRHHPQQVRDWALPRGGVSFQPAGQRLGDAFDGGRMDACRADRRSLPGVLEDGSGQSAAVPADRGTVHGRADGFIYPRGDERLRQGRVGRRLACCWRWGCCWPPGCCSAA